MRAEVLPSGGETAHTMVAVRDGRLYVESTGDGPPLLMIHGWPLDHRLFDPQVAGLKRDMALNRYDRRGFGKSDAPPDLLEEVADIDVLLDTLNLSSVHLLGMSQGGRIALRYAVTRPGRIRSLILQGTAVDGLESISPRSERVPLDEYTGLARRGDLVELRRRWLNHPMMRIDAQHRSEATLLQTIMDGYDGKDLLSQGPDSYAYPVDVLAALPAMSRPTLLLTGALECESRKLQAAKLLARLPDCREVVLEGAGHLSNLTAAAVYNDAVREFCLQVESCSR